MFVYTETLSRQYHWREGHWKLYLKEQMPFAQSPNYWKNSLFILETIFEILMAIVFG